ncbi:NB-ARC domain protein [Streptomyces lincolnensis]|uniref:NB-ARC domain protein n=1 Tax=Streptomyces lincolnensis TaxID=1915 RepID=A0A1B1MJ98_STRLN|nr:NB-ARC domain-containing protein [Streptomyces lincolnensis]ANS68706.1 NB-ARC domain protein [Streptomyces lincolnensis]AXG53088.1 NB-ARC domain protein [Streptomyces lincolnensis]QMV10315.1 hypothetical protein GJU35_34770 [Streptomyces lincolnensis]
MVRSSSGSHRAASSARAAVPAPPPHHIERTALLDTVRGLLLPGRKPSGTAVVGLVGTAGSCKSTLARAVATDADVTAHFEQVLWIEADPGADPVDHQHRLSAALGDARPVPDAASGMERLSELLADGRRLIVLDGVERREQWDAVDLSGLCSLLVTSRDHDILHGRGEVYEIRRLDARSSDRLFTAWAGPRDENPSSGDTSFAVMSAGLPLSPACAGALVAHGWSPHRTHMRLGSAVLSRLRADTPRPHPDDSRPYLMAALDVAVSALDGSLLERYLSLAVFEGRGPVPVEVAALLWRSTGERGPDSAPRDMPAESARRATDLTLRLRPDTRPERIARVVALAHLTPYLPEDGLVEPVAGQLVTAHVGILLPALRKMAPRMSPGVLHRTIGRAEEHHDDEDMMLVMAVLAPWMTGEGRAVLEFLPGAARLRPDARFRCRLLTLVAENLPAAAAAPLLAEAWSQARLISGPETRADALTALARLFPEPRRTEVFHDASTAAAAVEGLADRAATAARIARTVAETRTVDTAWQDFGRPALRLAALLGRAAVAEQLAHPSSGDVLGTAAQDIARALHDVTRWWP